MLLLPVSSIHVHVASSEKHTQFKTRIQNLFQNKIAKINTLFNMAKRPYPLGLNIPIYIHL